MKYLDSFITVELIVLAFILGNISHLEAQKEPILVVKVNQSIHDFSGKMSLNRSLNTIDINLDSTDIYKADMANKTNIVASKNGTRYYFTWCSGVSRIKEENKVYFRSVEEAQNSGLKPASNCAN